jgi:hypothetical protein
MELRDPSLSTPALINASGNGVDGWKSLSYQQLADARQAGLAMQDPFARIDTDDPDLTAFRDRGGKMILYHGLSDNLIPPQGSMNYYQRVLDTMGGTASVQTFFRMYLVPGMAHGFENGTANPDARPPLRDHDVLYRRLTDWVERGAPSGEYTISTPAGSDHRSWPLCLYPARPVLVGSEPTLAASYRCSA